MDGILLILLGALSGLLHSEEDASNSSTFLNSNSVCDLPLAVGDCKLNITRYFYNKDTNQCYKFLYSGCKGNGNRFISEKQCLQRCHQQQNDHLNAILKDLIQPPPKPIFNNLTCENCHTINGICVNNKCQCRMGYQLVDYKCVDVDECQWTTCGLNSICINSLGSFRCECALDFAGSGLNCSRSQEICGQKFDRRYEENCNNTEPSWQLRYFYDYKSRKCQHFRYGGCQFAGEQNIFRDLQACQSLCGSYRLHKEAEGHVTSPSYEYSQTTEITVPALCYDPFDESKRNPCTHGQWKARYYFDQTFNRCIHFWYDESCDRKPHKSKSRNIFVHLRTCEEVCERTTGQLLESRNQGIAGVIQAVLNKNWDEAKRVRDQLLMTTTTTTTEPSTFGASINLFDDVDEITPLPQVLMTTTPEPVITTPFESATQNTKYLFDDVISPLPLLPETPSPFSIELKMENNFNDSILIDQNIIGEEEAKNDILVVKTLNENVNDNINYSLAVNLPVTIAEECLDEFDKTLARSCQQIPDWKARYYFDSTLRTCKMYWHGGCWSESRNDFDDLQMCKWKCEGAHHEPISHSCLDKFDHKYLGDCRNGVYDIRYYFNHESKTCASFYFGGCQSHSKNFFIDRGQCQEYCETVPKDLSGFCLQPFDPTYRNSCTADGSYTQYYYYDPIADSCKMFWYGNCKSKSHNIFATLESCQWLCERKQETKVPQHCLDKFDLKYRDACKGGKWVEKYYFDHTSGRCRAFWYDGCISESQNIFKNRESCVHLCEVPSMTTTPQLSSNETTAIVPENEKPQEIDTSRCLESLAIGDCKETLPAYFYNVEKRICEPFSYSGCRGNGNRFMTLSQCDQTCGNFKHFDATEANCFLPLSIGFGRKRKTCIRNAGYYFYYNLKEQKCGRFWYLGCGGNANRFHHATECGQVCRRSHEIPPKTEPLKSVNACFQGISKGKCENNEIPNNLTRWAYIAASGKCEEFEFDGCGGNENRFATQHECNKLCQKLIAPNSMQCAHYPDWGPCNRLRYMWYYNLTSGSCEQFLYGGCGGNENRFSTFEVCQVTCEVPGEDPCMDKLDRGKWCESMSNRYYYHAKSKTCKGFHYTGCGQSRNNFLQLDECENVCVHRKKSFDYSVPIISNDGFSNATDDLISNGTTKGIKYSGKKPLENKPMIRHQILNESDKHYLKTEGQWVEYGHCLGFRYNISGPNTKLNSFICLMEKGGTCQIQTLTDTGGEERCRVIRPWLRGSHYYSWFFTIERRNYPSQISLTDANGKKQKRTPHHKTKPQKANDTVASLIILPLNDCYNIC